MGVFWGVLNDFNILMVMVNVILEDWVWFVFSLGCDQMFYVVVVVFVGGNVWVGLEDNLFLEKGVFVINV